MRSRVGALVVLVMLCGLVAAACGGPPAAPQPPPTPSPPPTFEPPANAAPTIGSVTAQGRRPKQPARLADVREVLDVTVAITDPETPVEELTYEWTAPVGAFEGTGRRVTWRAPDTPVPREVTLQVKVTEHYGHPGQPKNFKHEVTSTVVVRLHDSVREVGDMAVRFLTEFSKPQSNQDWQDIMKDFKASACPNPGDVENERNDVIAHYTNYVMNDYSIGNPDVTVNFGGACPFRARPGDACVAVSVFWDSTDKRNNDRDRTSGVDHLAAVYSNTDSRWWLCSSDYQPADGLQKTFYSR